jgi:hypothetical protein
MYDCPFAHFHASADCLLFSPIVHSRLGMEYVFWFLLCIFYHLYLFYSSSFYFYFKFFVILIFFSISNSLVVIFFSIFYLLYAEFFFVAVSSLLRSRKSEQTESWSYRYADIRCIQCIHLCIESRTWIRMEWTGTGMETDIEWHCCGQWQSDSVYHCKVRFIYSIPKRKVCGCMWLFVMGL